MSKIQTRTQTLKKILDKKIPRSPNTSYEIVISNNKESGKQESNQINLVLQNKLAAMDSENNELKEQIKNLTLKLNELHAKCDMKTKIINDLRDIIKKPNQSCDVTTQTTSLFRTASRETQTIPLSTSSIGSQTLNEFPALAKPITVQNNSTTAAKKKLLILSDSHGRNFQSFLQDKLPAFNVFTFFKPGAQLSDVIKDLGPLTANFTKQDFVFILGGTNNFPNNNLNIPNTLKKIVKSINHTNLIFSTIPYRYDTPSLNNSIYYINDILFDVISDKQNCYLFDLNFYLERKDYTAHRLHIRKEAKNILCNKLINIINFNMSFECNQTIHSHNQSF